MRKKILRKSRKHPLPLQIRKKKTMKRHMILTRTPKKAKNLKKLPQQKLRFL